MTPGHRSLKGPDGNGHRNVEALSILAGRSVRQHLIVLLAARHLPSEIFSAVCEDAENLVFVYLITRQPSREFEVYFLNWATEISSTMTVDEYRRLSARTFANRRAELAARFGREFPVLDGRSLKQFQLRYLLGKLTQHVDLAAYGAASAGQQWLSRYCDGGANQIERSSTSCRRHRPHWWRRNLAPAQTMLELYGQSGIWSSPKARLINRSATHHSLTSGPFIQCRNSCSPEQFLSAPVSGGQR